VRPALEHLHASGELAGLALGLALGWRLGGHLTTAASIFLALRKSVRV
jgi:hypothetical protein